METIQRSLAGLLTGPLNGIYFMWNIFMAMVAIGMWDMVRDGLWWSVMLFTIGLWTFGFLAFYERFYYSEEAWIRIPLQAWAYLVRLLSIVLVVLAVVGALNKDGD